MKYIIWAVLILIVIQFGIFYGLLSERGRQEMREEFKRRIQPKDKKRTRGEISYL